MKQILVRGKTATGKWIEGCGAFHEKKKSYICTRQKYTPDTRDWDTAEYYERHPQYELVAVEVIPETISEFLEAKDENRKKIFEGDIIRKTNEGRHPHIFVACIRCAFPKEEEVYYGPFEHFTESVEYEVVGNKWDNPELLEEK